MHRTLEAVEGSPRNYAIYYADFINENDLWDQASYKEIQKGIDIGERMSNALANGFSKSYSSVVLIGADIYDLTSDIIDESFSKLVDNDVVIGPAKDGGYYLIGMKRIQKGLFDLKEWSTSSVLRDTIHCVKREGLTYELLDELKDIDYQEDLEGTDLLHLISAPQDHG